MGLLGDAIKRRREERQESRAALALQIGLSESQLGVLEKERDLPTLPTLKKVALFFKFSPEEVGRYVLSSSGQAPGPRRKRGVRRGA